MPAVMEVTISVDVLFCDHHFSGDPKTRMFVQLHHQRKQAIANSE